jgi:integrase
VLNAFRRAKEEKKVRILMIGGPVISVEESSRENKLLDLVTEKIIELYIRPRRHTLFHYRIISDEKIYIEEPHEAFASPAERYIITPQNPKGWIKYLEADFDRLISERKVELSQNPKKDFLLLTPSEIKLVRDKGSKLDKDYDLLTRDEIEELLNFPLSL